MKKIILLIALFYSLSFCQDWNSIVTSISSVPNISKTDLFTNKDGNHLLIKKSNGDIVYYNLNSAGEVDANKTYTLETGADFPNIVGSNNKVYALYKVGNLIKGKYSLNGGTSWTALSDNTNPTSNVCNGVDAVYDPNNGVHLVWATKDNNGTYYETYYNRLNSSDQWVDYKQVTDYGSEVGGFPTVSFSSSRVHVGYNTGTESVPMSNLGTAKSRDKNGSSWETPQTIFSTTSAIERLHAGVTKLFSFYYKLESGVFKLCVKTRDLSGTTWSSETILQTGSDLTDIVSITTTPESKTHIVYSGSGYNEIYRNFDGSSWSSEYQVDNAWGVPVLASAGNDLFVASRNLNNNGIRYRQYDAIPSIPQNNQISFPLNQNPVLTWDANPQPDIAGYRVFKEYKDSDGYVLFSGSELKSATTYSYTDNTFTANYKTGTDVAAYWVKAEDLNSYVSGETSHLSGNGVSYYQQKIVRHDKTEKTDIEVYGLSQNYPNPFNPSTEIVYQIPSKGFVTLKVYDMLGNEVSTLINEWQEQGSYSAQFNTSGKQLASGMYFYTLTAGKFTDTKKFILLK